MANLIRIRNLVRENDLSEVIIPVDKQSYLDNAKQVSISGLTNFIMSGFTAPITTYSHPGSTTITVGGIPENTVITNWTIQEIFDMMFYSIIPTTTITTTPVPTTTTTTTPVPTTTTSTTPAPTTTTSTTPAPTTTTTTTLPLSSYCYTPRYDCDDTVHPDGGSISWYDQFGIYNIQVGYCNTAGEDSRIYIINASSTPSAIGMNGCTPVSRYNYTAMVYNCATCTFINTINISDTHSGLNANRFYSDSYSFDNMLIIGSGGSGGQFTDLIGTGSGTCFDAGCI